MAAEQRQAPCPCCRPEGCEAPPADGPTEPRGCRAYSRVGAAAGLGCRCLATTTGGYCQDCARWVEL